MYCLCTNEALPYNSLDDAPETSVLVQNLSDDKAVAIFWVAATLVEEVGKTDSSSMKQWVLPPRSVYLWADMCLGTSSIVVSFRMLKISYC
jgi:hypothetical protein